ncbi:MAG: formylglycine-generating enzyme family protein [Saprospiraceae bacterium]|nr:formylglycine-generating enzyme family protein [Saprospiraceae bacterium]
MHLLYPALPSVLQRLPQLCMFSLILLLPVVGSAQEAQSCCARAKQSGQTAFNNKNYDEAIRVWTNGKRCSDAAKCPDLDALIKKAKDAQAAAKPKPVPPAPKPQPRPQGPTEAERKAQAADQAAKAAFDIAKDIHSVRAYELFLNNHGSSRYAAEAHRLKKALEAAAEPQPVQTQPSTSTTPDKPALPAPITRLEADMVRITGGTFTMGCKSGRDTDCYDDEKPSHEVRLRDFNIGKYEVTQAQWRAVMGSDPSELYNKGCDQCPVERVSWNDIQDFLKKLNALTGKRYRLPTEAEWEYAARGGNQSRGYLYSGSNTIGDVAWYDANAKSGNTNGAQKTTRPVGAKNPNELGLYDMSGNVWEWCEDDWHGDYKGAPMDGSAWVDSTRASYRVHRGGGWRIDAGFCRAANRNGNTPADRNGNVGFRLAL